MKLVSYSDGGGVPCLGYIEGGEVHPLYGSSMLDYVEYGYSADGQLDGQTVPLSEARQHLSIARPSKIIRSASTTRTMPTRRATIGLRSLQSPPSTRTPYSVLEAIRIPPITEQADYEAELAVVIARPAKDSSI